MLHLNTQEVVLSIEKSPLEINHGILYQKYPNFFGNTFEFDFDKKENFEKLENQTKLNRVKLSKHDIDMKKLTVFFMNSSITQALEKKFNTKLTFDSADVWMDGKGYKLVPHVDDASTSVTTTKVHHYTRPRENFYTHFRSRQILAMLYIIMFTAIME